MLLHVPNLIAKDLEPESTAQKSAEDEQDNIDSPILGIVETSAAEQEGMLLPVPNLIAKDLEPESTVQKSAEDEHNNIDSPILGIVGTSAASAVIDEGNTANTFVQEANGEADKSKEPVLIDIKNKDDQQGVDDPDIALWYYKDENQVTRGPVRGRDLKRWNEKGFFWPGFKVWKEGQTPVLLNNMISQMFPN